MRIDVVFPAEVYDFLERLCIKMQNVPITQPMTNTPIPDPVTGQPVPMSRTGKVNEFIHIAIMQTFLPIVIQNPNFIEEQAQTKRILDVYQEYMTKLLGDKSSGTGRKITK